MMSNSIVPAYWPAVPSKIAVVAEAPGAEEEKKKVPLVGASGQLLSSILHEVGINPTTVLKTNVFNERPPKNDLSKWCSKKKDVGKDYTLPPVSSGQYIRKEFLHHLPRLADELRRYDPNVVLALGNTAIWGLCGRTGIAAMRGAVTTSTLVPGLKIVPSYHPAAVLRQYDLKVILQADCLKAKREAEFPEVRRVSRKIYIPQTPEEAQQLLDLHCPPGSIQSVDIETRGGTTLTCIGFAPSPRIGVVIPFWDSRRAGNHYWEEPSDEAKVYRSILAVLQDPRILKFGQNFVSYDTWFLKVKLGITVRGIVDDTMLQAHALQPEMEKGLGFLSSIHCDEPAYKLFRPRGKGTEKRDE